MTDDPNKLIQTFFKASKGETNWRVEAEDFAKYLQYISKKNLPDTIADLDLAIFRQGQLGIHEGFDGLARALTPSDRTNDVFMHLRYLMAAVFILGQSTVMSPKMKRVFLSKIQSERGRGGVKRKREIADAWQAPVLAFANDLRAINRTLNQGELASKIRQCWDKIDFKGNKTAPKNHAYLVRQISKWENSKKLPPAMGQ